MRQLYLLFSDLPFDFQGTELPQQLTDEVWLESSQEAHALLAAHPEAAAMVVPHLAAGLGQVHICLRTSFDEEHEYGEALTRMWWALAALRLQSPIHYDTSGYFASHGPHITHFQAYTFRPIVRPRTAGKIDQPSIEGARAIGRALRLWRDTEAMARPLSGLVLFVQSTMGLVNSWQLSALGLCAALEALFPHPKRGQEVVANEGYGRRLGRRVGRFLGDQFGLDDVRAWLTTFYNERRNPMAHGMFEAPTGREQSLANDVDILRLHEITRLVMLGMLGTPVTTLQAALPVNASARAEQQRVENDLPTASPQLLAGQQAHLAGAGEPR